MSSSPSLRPPKSLTLPVNQILCGDAVELMRGLPDASIHAIVTDPPYGLEFMGEEWDSFKIKRFTSGEPRAKDNPWEKEASGYGFPSKNWRCKKCGHYKWSGTPCKCEEPYWDKRLAEFPRVYQSWTTAWAREALRVLLPGASMLVMGGTRTYHRMACGVEDAGFEICDTVLWCYNSGFPKSQDLGALIDESYFEEQFRKMVPNYQTVKDKIFSENPDKKIARKKWNKWRKEKKKELGLVRRIVGKNPNARHGGGQVQIIQKDYEQDNITIPFTSLAREWDGWKVGGLKPSYEPVVWAVKPPEGSTTDNVLKHGVGAINVDACRIPYEGEDDIEGRKRGFCSAESMAMASIGEVGFKPYDSDKYMSERGRYPANMVRTDRFEDGYDRFYFVAKADRGERDEGLDGMPGKNGATHTGRQSDSQGLQNPGSKGNWDGISKNFHPTVKPVRLMEHLIKLVTRLDQIVLDPFVGSGTTCIAARKLLRQYIGIDNNAEYCEIAKKRLAAIPPPLEAFA